jgi:hypothetical protein
MECGLDNDIIRNQKHRICVSAIVRTNRAWERINSNRGSGKPMMVNSHHGLSPFLG